MYKWSEEYKEKMFSNTSLDLLVNKIQRTQTYAYLAIRTCRYSNQSYSYHYTPHWNTAKSLTDI